VAMKPLSELEPKMVRSKAVGRQSRKDGAEPACRPISMLSFLEAENVRLQRTVVELSRDNMALREALRKSAGV